MKKERVIYAFKVLWSIRSRFAWSLFYAHLLCSYAAFSQRSLTSFGILTDIHLGYRPQGITVGRGPMGKTEIAVLAPEQPAVHLYEISNTDRPTSVAVLKTQRLYRVISAADVTGDGNSEYLALSAQGNVLAILKRLSSSAYNFEEQVIELQSRAQKCLVADLNNDKHKDILLLGKQSSGIATLLGQANGTFTHGPLLFPDISVSDAVTTDINADGVVDILLLNWLSNQLTVFYGISRLIYTEQVAVQLPSEPSALAITNVSREHAFRIAITLPESREVHVYSGNSLGDYRLQNSLSIAGLPNGVQFTELNGDGVSDIVTGTQREILIALGGASGDFSAKASFGAARSIGDWTCADVDGDGRSDCVLIDEDTGRLITLFNTEKTAKGLVAEYCVGSSPKGVTIGDFAGSGKFDIAVANSESSTLSVLTNRGRGRFDGQIAITLPENPTSVVMVQSTLSSNKTLLVSHSGDDKVTMVALAEDPRQSQSLSVPTGAEPFVLSANLKDNRLQFFVRHRSTKDRSYLLSSFEQISATQFVEQSLRTTLPTRIIAINVYAGQNPSELFFATNDQGRTTISSATSESGMEFKSPKPWVSFADSTVSTRFIVSGFLNNDALQDGIVVLGPPRNALGIWFGKSTTATRDTIEWVRDVQPVSDDNVIIEDLNNDRVMDIAWLDGLRRAVVALYGNERKGFRVPTIIAPAEDVQAIRIAPLRVLDELDLVMSHGERGTISVIINPFNRQK